MNFDIEITHGKWDGDTFIEPVITIKALDGTFEEAKPKIEAMLASMGLNGIKLAVETPIESHLDHHEHTSVLAHRSQ